MIVLTEGNECLIDMDNSILDPNCFGEDGFYYEITRLATMGPDRGRAQRVTWKELLKPYQNINMSLTNDLRIANERASAMEYQANFYKDQLSQLIRQVMPQEAAGNEQMEQAQVEQIADPQAQNQEGELEQEQDEEEENMENEEEQEQEEQNEEIPELPIDDDVGQSIAESYMANLADIQAFAAASYANVPPVAPYAYDMRFLLNQQQNYFNAYVAPQVVMAPPPQQQAPVSYQNQLVGRQNVVVRHEPIQPPSRTLNEVENSMERARTAIILLGKMVESHRNAWAQKQAKAAPDQAPVQDPAPSNQ